MHRKKILGLLIAATVAAVAGTWWLLRDANIAVLNPKGKIAAEQAELLVIATILILVIVIPVFVLTFFIAWKYRAGNKKAEYRPDWDGDNRLEALWWGVPFFIVVILSGLIWTSSHALDPYKPLDSDKKPLQVQVVALQWKWLFLYPEQNIATVNFLQAPVDAPINLYNTSDAPMNSLWIPQLGGQIYAMNGMVTQLHLIANQPGDYRGLSANISGEGFSGMDFTARMSSEEKFEEWVNSVKNSEQELTIANYKKLAQPSKNVEPKFYASYDENLYKHIIMKYMGPMEGNKNMEQAH